MLNEPLRLGQSFFLFGLRGTGKTTWLKERLPGAVFLDLLDGSLYTDLLARPERLRDLVPADGDQWVVIDEVQRVPEVLNEVHRLTEERHTRFALTGPELGADARLDVSMQRGRLPAAWSAPDARAFLKSYVQTYLREEVQQEGFARNRGAFSRFLEAAAFSQGSLLNLSEVSRECAVERKTAAGYFQVLEDLLLASTLPVFARRARRRLVAHSKFFYFDCGVYRALRPAGPLDGPEEIEGAVLESLVYQELRALNDYLGLGYELYFWRSAAGAEVDFVLYGERGILAIVVKRSRRITSADLSGIRLFHEDYPEARCVVLCGVPRREHRDGIQIIPLEEGFAGMKELLSSPPGTG